MTNTAGVSTRPGALDSTVPSLSRVAGVYVGLVCLAGAAAFAHSLLRLAAEPPPPGWVILAMLTLISGPLAIRFPSQHASVSVSEPFVLALAVLFGPAPAVLTVIIDGGLVSLRARRPTLHRLLFNITEPAVSVWGACHAFHLVTGGAGLSSSGSLSEFVFALLVLIATYYLLNGLLQLTAVWLETGQGPLALLRGHLPHSSFSFAASILIVLVLARHPEDMQFLIGGIVLPSLLLTYLATRSTVRRIEQDCQHTQALTGMVATTRDALARAVQSESALVAEKERLALARARLAVTVRSIHDGVVSMDPTGAVLLMNDAAQALASMAESAAVNRPAAGVFAALGFPAQVYEPALDAVLAAGQSVRIRNDAPGYPQPSRLVEITGTPTRDGDSQIAGAVWVMRDVSDAARAEHERSKAARLESPGVLAGGLAHDFNNILIGVVGNLSLAQTMVEPEHTALKARLTHAEAACLRARGVTNQLLTFAKGGMPVRTTASVRELAIECTSFALSGSPVRIAPWEVLPEDRSSRHK